MIHSIVSSKISQFKSDTQENQFFFQVVMMVKILSSKVSKKGVGINELLYRYHIVPGRLLVEANEMSNSLNPP